MADSHAKMTQATPQEIIISVLAGLLAPLLAIFLIVQLVLGIQAEQQPDSSGEAAQKAALARIKPFAQLVALDANAPKVERSGQEVYDAVCVSCHGSGALGAPRFDNKSDWAGRLGQGYDTLVKHAIEGIRQMPPRGGDGDLSDVEMARAVAYLANSAGANFTAAEPAAPAPVAAAATAPTEAAAEAAPTPAASTAATAAIKADPTNGKQVYQTTCALCHAAGIAGAPKPGDMAAWAPRVAQGNATLYKHAINGIRGMPAKGGNPALADADVKAAVDYIVGQSR